MGCADCSVLFVLARAMTTTTSDQKRSRRPRYWVGPLLAGACFALGYGITQRVVLMRQALDKPQQATFRQNSFPGESLDGLRRRYGADQPLMGDVAAQEALDAEQRKANEQAEAIAKQAQQAAVPEPGTDREEPVSTAAPLAAPALDVDQPESSDGAQPAAVLTPNADPVAPEPAAATDPAIEPSVQVAPEPEPASVATPEPAVTPAQPAIDESLIFKAPPATPPATP